MDRRNRQLRPVPETLRRNQEIVRLRAEGVKCREIASRFGLSESYVPEIVKEMKRYEAWKASPESLDAMSVRTVFLLSQKGVHSINDLKKLVSTPDWKDGLPEKAAKEIEILVEGFK